MLYFIVIDTPPYLFYLDLSSQFMGESNFLLKQILILLETSACNFSGLTSSIRSALTSQTLLSDRQLPHASFTGI